MFDDYIHQNIDFSPTKLVIEGLELCVRMMRLPYH